MRGLWKLPDPWKTAITDAGFPPVLGRRQTDAGAHSYHRPQRCGLNDHQKGNLL